MVCAACKYIHDPNMGGDEISYSQELFTEIGGKPFIASPDIAGAYACPMCGTIKLDLLGEMEQK